MNEFGEQSGSFCISALHVIYVSDWDNSKRLVKLWTMDIDMRRNRTYVNRLQMLDGSDNREVPVVDF